MTNKTDTQRLRRRTIDVVPGMDQVLTANYWYQAGQFWSDHEARGAFKLAYQQGMDGMGSSVAQWMGLSAAEFKAWMRDHALPKRRGER